MSAPPDDASARARRLVLLYGLTALATNSSARSLDPILPEIARDLVVTTDRIALIASAFALPYALVQPVLGPVGDALGKRRVIVVATVLTGLALVACALAPGAEALFLFRALAGAAAGGIYPLVIATFGDRIPVGQRQVALSQLLAFSIIGQIGGSVASGLLHEALSWRGIIAISAGAVLVAATMLVMELRREPERPAGTLDAATALRRYGEILRLPLARRLFGSVGVEGLLVFGMFPYLAAVMAGWGLGGPLEAGLAVGSFGAAGIAYAFLSRLLLTHLGLPAMLRLAGVLGGAGFAAVALSGGLVAGPPTVAAVPVFLGMFLLGLGYFTMHNSLQTRVTEVAPRARGSAVAMHAFSFFVGQSLGPVLYGPLIAGLGAMPALLGSAAAMLALGLVLSRVMRMPVPGAAAP